MRRLARLAGGVILYTIALLLSLPGVSVVRADGTDPAPRKTVTSNAPMCRADAPIAHPAAVDRMAEALRAQAGPQPSGQPEVRVLDGRGYNYVTARREVDFQALERELRLRRAR